MRLHKNIRLWYVVFFFSNMAFILPIWVIFNTDVLGLTNTQAFILGMLPFGLSSVFDVLTGSWADRYGRIKVFRLGILLVLISTASYVFFRNFYVLLAFQVLGGLGRAMDSGSLEALAYDSVQSKDRDAIYAKIHGRKMAVGFAARVVAVLCSGILYASNPRLPYLVQASASLVAVALSFLMIEVRVSHSLASSHVEHIKQTLDIVRKKRTLVLLIVLGALYSVSSEILFALYQPYFKSIHVHIGEFGVFYAIISLCSAIAALLVAHVAKRISVFRILLGMMVCLLITLVAMLAQNAMLTYVAIIPSSLALGFIITLQNTAVQKHISSKHQATAISIVSFTRTVTMMIGIVLLGMSLDRWSVARVNWLVAVTVGVLTIPFVVSVIPGKLRLLRESPDVALEPQSD